MRTIDLSELKLKLLQDYKIIDVRAPLEFAQGALPNSVNLPVLDDQERALVGTCYKKINQEKAIELGHQIVSGENKRNKISKWIEYIEKNPHTIMTCFRGGLRSRISQGFLAESGIEIDRIENGYKEVRQYFIDELNNYANTQNLRLLTGNTGSGKTKILKQASKFYPVIDLEELAQHRGSAFGSMKNPQPAQATFENSLSFEILKLRSLKPDSRLLFEDESRLIGSLHLPDRFFDKLRKSSVIKMNVALEERIENIFADYIYPEAEIFEKYSRAITKISKKLGGLRAQELLRDLTFSNKQFLEEGRLVSNKIWIEKLLVWYYDPMYSFSLLQRDPLVEFEGGAKDVIEYLKQFSFPHQCGAK